MNHKHYRRMLLDSFTEDQNDQSLDKATKTPSKHVSWRKLEQTKKDHGVLSSGGEYHQDELDSAIVDAKVRDAEKMVQQADRMQRRTFKKSAMKKTPAEFTGGGGSAFDKPNHPSDRFNKIHEEVLPNGMMHSVSVFDSPAIISYHHTITHPEHGLVAHMTTSPQDDKNSVAQIDTTVVDRNHRGKGIGQALYNAALGFHGKLRSDTVVSREAMGRHKAISEFPGVKSNFNKKPFLYRKGPEKGTTNIPGDAKAANSYYEHKVSDKKAFQEAAWAPKKLAASELKNPYPGRVKDKEFRRHDKAVEAAGRRHDKMNTPETHKDLEMAIAAREDHIAKNPQTKEHLNRLNAHMNEKYGGDRPMRKSSLQKSRPRITFPRFKRVTTRPDQEVQTIESTRQKDLFGRKVANANFKDQKNVPYTQVTQKPDGTMDVGAQTTRNYSAQDTRDMHAKRTAGSLGRNTLGLNYSTKEGPKAAALAGKLRSKFEEGDDEHVEKKKQHVQAKNKIISDYNNAYMNWRSKAMELSYKVDNSPEDRLAWEEHRKNRPEKPKLPRAPSKKVKETAKLSPEKQAIRGRAVDSTLEHEGHHLIMDDLERKYGKQVGQKVHRKVIEQFDPEAIQAVGHYISRRLKYKPTSPSFTEEIVAHARDILTNPKKREDFSKFIGSKEAADKHIKNLKIGHQKAYKMAQNLDPSEVGHQEEQEPKKLASSENSTRFNFPRFTKVSPK